MQARALAASPRLAIGQFRMAWTIEENLASIAWCMRQAAAAGARICSFPELAVTGFHRRIVEHAVPPRMDEALR
ncbi:MAG TPA: nitrilase-related carbon-nitrogen hydrolase, partial [Ramlibacter sp.]